MLQEIQVITEYRVTAPACDNDAFFSDTENHFYSQHEAQNSTELITCLCMFQGHQHYASDKTVKHVLSQCLLAHSTHPIIRKCFKSLLMRHIKIKLPISLNPLQFS
ncbi:hypothetical protein QTP86_022233 [Hemibagrus guttatus]|nr:hypothetical protein QTP86_022233 [Hemibagrus guttatus]